MDQTTNKPYYIKTDISWKDQVVTILPLALFIASLIQLLAVYKYFDLSIYDNQSIEILSGSLNSVWEKLFAFNSVFIVIVNFVGLVGFVLEKKWSYATIILGAVLTMINSLALFNPISLAASLVWFALLLQIRKEFV